jgi:hypothetical protein
MTRARSADHLGRMGGSRCRLDAGPPQPERESYSGAHKTVMPKVARPAPADRAEIARWVEEARQVCRRLKIGRWREATHG